MQLRPLLFFVVATCLAGPAAAQSIDTVTPAVGSPGQVITIDGTGLDDATPALPKVFLRNPVTGKKTNLQVTVASDTQLTVVFKGGLPGVRDLVVIPKGQPEIVEVGGFEVMLPVFTAVDSGGGQADHAAPGQQVTANGQFLGTIKGSVRIGTKPAKIVSWGDGAIEFLMPPKLEDGFYSVTIKNKVGSTVVSFAVIVTGGTAGKHLPDTLTAKLDKAKFVPTSIFGLPIVFVTPDAQAQTINVRASGVFVSGQPSRAVELNFDFDPTIDAAQPLVASDPNGSIVYTETYSFPLPTDFTIWDTTATDTYSLVVHSFTANQFVIAFSGTLDFNPASTVGPPADLVILASKGKARGTLPP